MVANGRDDLIPNLLELVGEGDKFRSRDMEFRIGLVNIDADVQRIQLPVDLAQGKNRGTAKESHKTGGNEPEPLPMGAH